MHTEPTVFVAEVLAKTVREVLLQDMEPEFVQICWKFSFLPFNAVDHVALKALSNPLLKLIWSFGHFWSEGDLAWNGKFLKVVLMEGSQLGPGLDPRFQLVCEICEPSRRCCLEQGPLRLPNPTQLVNQGADGKQFEAHLNPELVVHCQTPNDKLNHEKHHLGQEHRRHNAFETSLINDFEVLLGHPRCKQLPGPKHFGSCLSRMVSATMKMKSQLNQASRRCQHKRKTQQSQHLLVVTIIVLFIARLVLGISLRLDTKLILVIACDVSVPDCDFEVFLHLLFSKGFGEEPGEEIETKESSQEREAEALPWFKTAYLGELSASIPHLYPRSHRSTDPPPTLQPNPPIGLVKN